MLIKFINCSHAYTHSHMPNRAIAQFNSSNEICIFIFCQSYVFWHRLNSLLNMHFFLMTWNLYLLQFNDLFSQWYFWVFFRSFMSVMIKIRWFIFAVPLCFREQKTNAINIDSNLFFFHQNYWTNSEEKRTEEEEEEKTWEQIYLAFPWKSNVFIWKQTKLTHVIRLSSINFINLWLFPYKNSFH